MATIVVKVCEECKRKSSSVDGWLVVSALDVRSAGSGRRVVHADSELDLCSPGCLLRYVSRSLDRAASWTAEAAPESENEHQAA